jgi:hypothetical protein
MANIDTQVRYGRFLPRVTNFLVTGLAGFSSNVLRNIGGGFTGYRCGGSWNTLSCSRRIRLAGRRQDRRGEKREKKRKKKLRPAEATCRPEQACRESWGSRRSLKCDQNLIERSQNTAMHGAALPNIAHV